MNRNSIIEKAQQLGLDTGDNTGSDYNLRNIALQVDVDNLNHLEEELDKRLNELQINENKVEDLYTPVVRTNNAAQMNRNNFNGNRSSIVPNRRGFLKDHIFNNQNNNNNEEKKNNDNEEKKPSALDKAKEQVKNVKDTANTAIKAKAKEEIIKKIGLKAVLSNPIFWVVILICVLVVFLLLIFVMWYNIDEVKKAEHNGYYYNGNYYYSYEYQNMKTITLIESDGTEKILDFEDYIAGVVTAESGDANYMEAMKSQAIIARTYAVRNSKMGTEPLKNSQANQVYKEPSEAGRQAAEATKGLILVDNNGDILPAFFASYPKAYYNSDKKSYPAYDSCSDVKCNDSTCTTTIYKLSSGNRTEPFEFTMDRYQPNGSTWNGADLTKQAGHCYGYSQLGARYLDSKGDDYKKIIDTFFFDYQIASMFIGDGHSYADAMGFRRREITPTSDSLYFNSSNNIFAKSGFVGQCTWYAHGRAKELLANAKYNNRMSDEEFTDAISILNTLHGDAGKWWQNNQSNAKRFAYGSEPKIGAIAVWNRGRDSNGKLAVCNNYKHPNAGHVAIVEDIVYNSDGDYDGLYISEAWTSYNNRWDKFTFRYEYWTKDRVQSYSNGCRKLSGFIYVLN